MLEINTQDNSGLISLSHAARLSGYHQDYLGQLCRAGKLPASKVGRNWFTSKEAVEKLSTPEIMTSEFAGDVATDFVDDQLYQNSLNDSQGQETSVEAVPQPVITQSITISKVDGIPVAIQSVENPTPRTSQLQDILTNMRIQALQAEVSELRELLARLMTEVTAHAKVLQAQSEMQMRGSQFQHAYVPSLDFGLAQHNYQSRLDSMAAAQPPQLQEESIEIRYRPEERFPIATWLAASAALATLVYIVVSIYGGSFLGKPNTEVSTVYYHSQNQLVIGPRVAGDSVVSPKMLPTGPATGTGQNMIQ